MTKSAERPRPRVLPPACLAGLLGLQAALHFSWPLANLAAWPWRWSGLLVVLLGVALVLWAAGWFARRATTIKPFEASSELVVEGPYRLTRNPMYAGMLLILGGTALALGSWAPWVAPALFYWWITTRFIVVEERMLEERFGERYRDYARRVGRWAI